MSSPSISSLIRIEFKFHVEVVWKVLNLEFEIIVNTIPRLVKIGLNWNNFCKSND